jgi:hypothetical protein
MGYTTKALGALAVVLADIRRSPRRKTVLLGRWFAAPPLTGRGASRLALALCADCDFRAIARFARNDTARAE